MTFKKGESGNPGGRPKPVADITELARAQARKVIRKLVELMQSGDEKIAFAAAQELLNRAYGKSPPQVSSGAQAEAGPVVIETRIAKDPGQKPSEAGV